MSVDPLANRFISFSPYNFVLNNPIIYIDPDGKAVVGINKTGRSFLQSFNTELFGTAKKTASGWREIVEVCPIFSLDVNGRVIYNEANWAEWGGPQGSLGKWTQEQLSLAESYREIVKSTDYKLHLWSTSSNNTTNVPLPEDDAIEYSYVDDAGKSQTVSVTLGEAIDAADVTIDFTQEGAKTIVFIKEGHPASGKIGWILLNESILKKELPIEVVRLEGIKKLGVLQSGGHEMFDHFAYLDSEDATRPRFGADPVEYYNLISKILNEKREPAVSILRKD